MRPAEGDTHKRYAPFSQRFAASSEARTFSRLARTQRAGAQGAHGLRHRSTQAAGSDRQNRWAGALALVVEASLLLLLFAIRALHSRLLLRASRLQTLLEAFF